MLTAIIPDYHAVIGKTQGYNGLAVRVESFDGVEGMTSAWEPTQAEIALLQAGAKIHISVLGSQPPMMVSVGRPPEF